MFDVVTLAAAAARASVILASAGLVTAALRRSSASARHLVWVLGLASALVVPALSLSLPKWELPIVKIAAAAPSANTAVSNMDLPANAVSAPTSASHAVTGPALSPNAPTAAPPSHTGVAKPAAANSFFTGMLARISFTTLLLAVWALGASLVLGRMLLGLAAVQWMSRRTRVVTQGPWLALAQGLAADLGLRRVRFVKSATASMPMAWGVLRPSVLMPADADTWPAHRLRVVLLHELAHVKRRDCLTHLVAQIVCAAYWFNPLAWMAVRRLRAERERACDDLVLAAGTPGPDYADELLDIARVMQSQRFPGVMAGASLAMAHRSQLEGRLIAILDPSVARRGLTRGRAAAAAAVFAILMVSVASVQPWAEEAAVSDATMMAAQQSDRPIEAYPGQAAEEVRRNARKESARQTELQNQIQGQIQGAVQGQVQGQVQSRVEGHVQAMVQGRAHGDVIADAVAGSIEGVADGIAGGVAEGVAGGVVGGVTGGVIGGVATGVAHIVEHAVPFAAGQTPSPTPNPNPNPNPSPRAEGKKGQIDPRAAAALLEALKDTDKDVRETAMHALVQMRDPRMFDPLVAALKDASPDVREQAAFGLGQLRDPRAIDALTTVLHDSNADVREQAVFALGQLRDRRSVDPLISALKDEHPDVRQQAAFALGQIRDAKAVEALVIALKDAKSDVREQAAFALGQLRDPRAIDGLTAAMKDPNASVRQQAAFALGQIRY